MAQIRIILSLLFLLYTFGNVSFAQEATPSKAEIKKILKQSAKYSDIDNYEKSLSTARQSLNYATIVKDDYLIAASYNLIAGNFDALSEFDKAIFYYNKGLLHANKTDNSRIKNWLNNNLGNAYFFGKKEYVKGINYYKKSLEYSQKTADTSRIIFTKLNITWAYFDIGHFDDGFIYLEFINKYHPKFGDKSTIVALNMLNGMYYSHNGENKKAESYFLEAIKLGMEMKEKSDLSYSHQEYSKFLLKKGDYKKAYENLNIYNTITEELHNKDILKKANVAGINFQLDEYKREIDKIETEKNLQYESLRKSKIIVTLFMIGLLILLLFMYSLYQNYNFKKKSNNELTIANEELIVAKEKAEDASKMKTQFVSTISHELRTPLYGVIGITNILLDEHKELADSPHLSSLKFSARYLLTLVNDILHINKIEENKIVLENQAFNISDKINIIIDSLSFIAQSNNDTITVEVDSKIPEYLIGDKSKLSQILMNLVSNALKFTKNGEVIVSANLIKVEGKSHFIEFQIKDNGVGIATSNQDKIFEKFVQVGQKDNDYQGTGLGLAIVKRLLELFKSEILLESEIGMGTTFKFTIAFDYDQNKTNEISSNIQVNLRPNQIFKVLVVEDNKINQTITKKIIEKNNCQCILADDGFHALEILSEEDFDVILMDINMPLMNGFEATRKIRLKGIRVPVIALTAFAKDEITEEAISCGMDEIIIKPFEPVKLFQVINDQINKTRNAG